MVNDVEYVFIRSLTPLNSTAARPFTAPRRIVGAVVPTPTERSRAKPLLSDHRGTGAPSACADVSASNHSCRPAVIGGVGDASPRACSDAPTSAKHTPTTIAAANA